MELEETAWESYEGQPTRLFTAKHKDSGFFVTLTDFGAHLLRVVVPDKHNGLGDVALTQESPELLVKFKAYQGATVGRTANRIAEGKFEIDGYPYSVYVNDEPNSLHGGRYGFDKKIWKLEHKHATHAEVTLKFSHESPDLEEGYPGALLASVTFTIRHNYISWEFEAKTNKTTIVNLTNHGYWNLDGLDVKICEQFVQILASNYGIVDDYGLFTGKVVPVEPGNDTRIPKKFAEIFDTFGDVDHNFFLDDAKNWTKNQRNLHFCAEAYSPQTGRVMTVRTTEPGVQLYTANSFGKNDAGLTMTNGQHPAGKHSAFCLETQRPPNAVNNQFRDWVLLHPGETYYHKTEHEFRLK